MLFHIASIDPAHISEVVGEVLREWFVLSCEGGFCLFLLPNSALGVAVLARIKTADAGRADCPTPNPET